MRTILGAALAGAGVLVLVLAFANAPSAQACATVNQIDGSPACSSGPGIVALVIAAVLVLAGLVLLFGPRHRT